MVGVADMLAVAALVLVVVASLLAWHVYRTLPAVYPPDDSPLPRRQYEVVRAGLVAGGLVGALGSVVALVDTAGTIAATWPGDGGLLARAAVAIPEWFASSAPLLGAAVLGASALLLLVGTLRDVAAE